MNNLPKDTNDFEVRKFINSVITWGTLKILSCKVMMKNYGKPDQYADHAFINFNDYQQALEIVEKSRVSPLIFKGQ